MRNKVWSKGLTLKFRKCECQNRSQNYKHELKNTKGSYMFEKKNTVPSEKYKARI